MRQGNEFFLAKWSNSGSSSRRRCSYGSSPGTCSPWRRHPAHSSVHIRSRRTPRRPACSDPRWRSVGHHCRPGRRPCHPAAPIRRRASPRQSCPCSASGDTARWWWRAHWPPADSWRWRRPPWSNPSQQPQPGRDLEVSDYALNIYNY